jgi:hypothetical protein
MLKRINFLKYIDKYSTIKNMTIFINKNKAIIEFIFALIGSITFVSKIIDYIPSCYYKYTIVLLIILNISQFIFFLNRKFINPEEIRLEFKITPIINGKSRLDLIIENQSELPIYQIQSSIQLQGDTILEKSFPKILKLLSKEKKELLIGIIDSSSIRNYNLNVTIEFADFTNRKIYKTEKLL